MGSVFKRGRHWQIRFDAPGPDGRGRQKQQSCGDMTKKQAEALLHRRMEEVRSGSYVDSSDQSFGDYLIQWLDCVAPTIAETTWRNYDCNIRNHVIPVLGSIRLQAVNPMTLQSFYDKLGRSALSAKTVRNIHGIIHRSLEQAVRVHMIQSNPAEYLQLPRAISPEIKTVSPTAIRRILDAAEGTHYHAPILIAAATGMRMGEVLGLQWTDFQPGDPSFDGRDQEIPATLTVRRSLAQIPGRVFIKETKTRRSRVVAIPPILRDRLIKEQRFSNSIFICAHRSGKRLTPHALDGGFRRICQRLGIEATMHGLRHTWATEQLAAGAPINVVSEALGHSTPQTTLRVYAHVLPHSQRETARVMQRLLETPSR
ncbi:MAG: hypothetical protein A2Z18_09770 [Armatimonadetes bacterium RBG_16_58_9]|nr:MAG: hypothetical protein A2Z18_09770 [Armatimonadetes bacterium RBG_16_58_9]